MANTTHDGELAQQMSSVSFFGNSFFRCKSILNSHCIGLVFVAIIIILSAPISSIRLRDFLHHFRNKIKYVEKTSTYGARYHQHDSSIDPRIRLWQPSDECKGVFTSVMANDASYNNSIPYAMIRDAIVDKTSSIRSSLSTDVFITLYVTVHLSAKLSKLTMAKSSLGRVVRIEQIDQFLQLNNKYKPGVKNRRGYSVSEWQISLSIPKNDIQYSSSLNLSLPLETYDNKQIKFNPWMHLSCVQGLSTSSSNYLEQPASCLDSTKSVVFGGKGIYGDDYDNRFKQLAHFAARSVLGSLKFSTVVMAVNVPYSQSEIQKRSSTENIRSLNTKFLQNAYHAVKEELIKLNVWDQFPENGLIIIPTCTLGTASQMNERCSLSSKHGQYSVGLLIHSLFSQYFKWSVSMDMDEFFYDGRQKREMVEALDEIQKIENRTVFTIKWFNFLATPDVQTDITNDLLHSKELKLKGIDGSMKSKKYCMNAKFDKRGRRADVTGKSAMRCDIGKGYRVHSPALRKRVERNEEDRLVYPERVIQSTSMRTWHARNGSVGLCAYSES